MQERFTKNFFNIKKQWFLIKYETKKLKLKLRLKLVYKYIDSVD